MAKAPLEIRSLARQHTARAIEVLAGIMNQSESADSARVAAANSLLDRGWGKAEQTTHSTVTRVDPSKYSDAELIALALATRDAGPSGPAASDPSEPDGVV